MKTAFILFFFSLTVFSQCEEIITNNPELISALSSAGTSRCNFRITSEVVVNQNTTIPRNINLIFENGGMFSGNGPLTINATLEAGLYQIFNMDAAVLEGSPVTEYIYPQWFGAIAGDNLTDEDAINKALIYAGKNIVKKTVFFPSGKYLIAKSIVLKNGTGILGENLRGTIIATKNFTTKDNSTENSFDSRNAMIINDLGDGKLENQSVYNTIENFFISNTENNSKIVMIWLRNQWEGSYIKNVHLYNHGVVRGGIWHYGTGTSGFGNNPGGGQFLVENINVFYGGGQCIEEPIKLYNNGGLWCNNWNIRHLNLTLPVVDGTTYDPKPLVTLAVQTSNLNASNIHIENTAGNNTPTLKLIGKQFGVINFSDSNVFAYNRSLDSILPNKEAIEISVTKNVDWNIENVSLKMENWISPKTGESWKTHFRVPLRVKLNGTIIDEIINPEATAANTTPSFYAYNEVVEKLDHISNNIRPFYKYSKDATYSKVHNIGEGVFFQQTLTRGQKLNPQEEIQIYTPHNMKSTNSSLSVLIDEIDKYDLESGSTYQAKGYMILVSAMDNNGSPRGGIFSVLTTHYANNGFQGVINPPLGANGVLLRVTLDKKLMLRNISGIPLSRVSVMVMGTGTQR